MIRSLFVMVVVLVPLAGRVAPVAGQVLPADDPILDMAWPLLVRGVAMEADWTVGPQEEAALNELLSASPGVWARRLESFRALPAPSGSRAWGIRLRAQALATPHARQDPLRPDAPSDAAVYQTVLYSSFLRLDQWTAGFGWRHDGWYDRDPDGLDAALRWAIRPEHTYVRYSSRYLDAMLGRVVQHWGAPSRPGLLLSDNPRPMDAMSMRFGTRTLSVRTSINELDSATSDGRFTGVAGDDSVAVGSDRRWLAAHRVDIRLNAAWSVALMHATLYSGPGSGLSLKYINPFNIALFSVDNRPKNDENNGFLGAEVRHTGPNGLFTMQVMLDDVDILNGQEPPSLAVTTVAERAWSDVWTSGMEGTVVTARTYNALQSEGKYLYLMRGLGTQYADFVHGRVHVERLLMPSNWLVRTQAALDVLWQGEGDFRQPFPSSGTSGLLAGTVRSVVRPSVRVSAMHARGLYARLDAGIAHGSLVDASGTTGTRFTGTVLLGWLMNRGGSLSP
ncbi:MAG: hypothetical protein RIE53_06255 [Rhodothermales bacterium]